MRTIRTIVLCSVLAVSCARFALAQNPPQRASTGKPQTPAAPPDELHFATVLTLNGEVAKVDLAKVLVTIKAPEGKVMTLEARSAEEINALKLGDRVVVRYVEGGEIAEARSNKEAAVGSLNDGLVGRGTSMKRHTVAIVQKVDAPNQEITVKSSDGSIETIIVEDPEDLGNVKVGGKVVIIHSEALALSIDKAS